MDKQKYNYFIFGLTHVNLLNNAELEQLTLEKHLDSRIPPLLFGINERIRIGKENSMEECNEFDQIMNKTLIECYNDKDVVL